MGKRSFNTWLITDKAFFTCLTVLLLIPSFASSQELYRFERMWPTPKQPWYFSYPKDVTSDAQGYIYVVDQYNNRIQKFTPDGAFVSRWGKEGSGNREFDSPGGIAVDADGYVYVSDTGNHRIQKFTPDGRFIGSWGAEGSGTGEFSYPSGITVGPGGYIYVADSWNHRIQKFTDNGTFVTRWGREGSHRGGFKYPSGIAADADGYIYVADTYNHRIQKFRNNGTFIFKWGKEGSGDKEFNLPSGIAADSEGFVYVVDSWNHRIQKFNSSGLFTRAWGGQGSGNGKFEFPSGITADKDGYILVADTVNNRIQRFTSVGIFISKWASSGSESGEFSQPIGIATGEDGSVYVADTGNHRIQKFSDKGTFVTQWGEQGTDNGQFDQPTGIAVDEDGYVYVADTGNKRVQKFSDNGTFVTQWGEQGPDNATFEYPYGIAADSEGFIHVSDPLRNDIQKFSDNGTFVSRWGIQGSEIGKLDHPYCIAVDAEGSVYVADNWNHRIQKFTGNGTFISEWGNQGSEDGELSFPTGIAVDGEGAVYVADTGNHRIQKFTGNGTFITAWGGFGSSPGQMSYPDAIALSPDGTLYVSDTENHRVQSFKKVTISTNNRAIIVAGGGPYPGNSIWDATQISANFAYRTLTYQGFTKKDIYYLSPDTDLDLDGNGLADDVDDNATNENLEYAITEWAEGADSLVLYLVDHGGDGIFRMNEQELLPADDLDSSLSTIEKNISGNVIIVYDACESGSFVAMLTPTAGTERIIVTSTSPGESAWFITKGSISFSNYFWTKIFNGLNIYDSFSLADQAVSYTTPDQNPLLDDNGNGMGNDSGDGEISKKTHIGNGTVLAEDAPVIRTVSQDQTISDNNSAILYADVHDPDGIARVWALVRPPDYTPGSPDDPVQQLPSLELLPTQEENRYDGTYDSFDSPGTYQVSIYAMDRKMNTSVPSLTAVRVENPLTRKAVIVAGASQSSTLSDAIEKMAKNAYESLHFQGYRDEDIYFMASSTFHQGVDALATADNIKYALTDWAPAGTRDVVLYLAGEGDNGTFKISGDETLWAEELGAWLEDSHEQLSGRITFVYDGPLSGSFIPHLAPPPGKQRILIASTGADQPAYFLSEGEISFSNFFWGKILNGSTVRDAFIHARNSISYAFQGQSPQIDDNGNGIANEYEDGRSSMNYTLGMGIMLAGDDPVIGSVSPDQTLNGTRAATIRAEDVTTTGEIEKVWAVITPPDFSSSLSAGPVTDLPAVTLKLSGENVYEGTYRKFLTAGTYEIAVFAMDEDGNISLPLQTAVHQMSEPACPAVLLSGGENGQTQLLRAFRDRVLLNTINGKKYVRLFYRHSRELAEILTAHPGIMAQCRKVLQSMAPVIESALEGKGLSIPQDMIPVVEKALDTITEKTGQRLKEDIKNLKKNQKNGKVFNLFEIKAETK